MRRNMGIGAAIVFLVSFMTFVIGCGGGGGGGSSIVVPTDPDIITTTVSKQAVRASANIAIPKSELPSPSVFGRISSRITESITDRVMSSISTNLYELEGYVGEAFYITFTNEPTSNCIGNGTLNGTVTQATQTSGTVSLSGTINLTSCRDFDDFSVTITNGSITASETAASATVPCHYTFPGNNYTMNMTNTFQASAVGDELLLTSNAYSGSDSLGNTYNFWYTYTSGHISSYYNRNKIDGTTNNISCSVNAGQGTMACSGSSSLSNGIALTYVSGGANFSVSEETNNGTVTMRMLDVVSGNISYTTNTGYSGTVAISADGTGSGVLKNGSNVTVASITWNSSGYCTVDYVDPDLPNDYFYLSNVIEELT